MSLNSTTDKSIKDKSTTLIKNSLNVVIIDDDKSLTALISEFYKENKFSTECFHDAESALNFLKENHQSTHLIVSDLNLPKKSGIDLIQELKDFEIDTPVILITAYGSVNDAALALKKGAFDYITKPLNFNELEVVSNRAIKIKNLEKNYKILQSRVNSEEQELIGRSPVMRDLEELISKVAASQSNILITGESGSGKEVAARTIHKKSTRSDKPFVPINCSAIPSELLEAELFGFKKGAFTGADESRIGLFEEAHGGTLFLDEIGDMPIQLQAKVLRAIQEKKIKPLGDNKVKNVNVRIIAATHQDLKQSIRKKEFREDLYFRLCVIPITIPPLRDRREDIPLLANSFLKKFNAINEKNITSLSKEAISKLKRLRWSGNVRELENSIERAVVMSNNEVLQESDISIDSSIDVDPHTNKLFMELLTLKELEKEYIKFVLDKVSGKKEEAADVLGINRKTLYRKEKEFEIT